MRTILLLLLLLHSHVYATKLYKNKESVLYSLQHELITLDELDISYRDDKEIVLLAIQKDAIALEYASDRLKRDREVVLEAVKGNAFALQYASPHLKKDKEVVLIALKNDPYANSYMDDDLYTQEFKNQKSEIGKLLRDEQETISELYADPYTQINNKEDAYQYIKDNPYGFNDLNKSFKYDPKILYEVLSNTGNGLQYADENLSNNRELMLKVMELNPMAFEQMNQQFRKDKIFVTKAIEYDTELLKYADASIRNDKVFLRPLIQSNAMVLEHSSLKIKQDKKYLLEITQENMDILPFCSKQLQTDLNFTTEIIRKTHHGLEYASKLQQSDKAFVLDIIQYNEEEFQYASKELKNDKAFILSFIDDEHYIHMESVIEYISPQLKNNKLFAIELLKKGIRAYSILSPQLKKLYQIKALSFNNNLYGSYYLKNTHLELLKDNNMVLKMMKTSGQGVEYLYKEQQDNPTLMLQALKNNPTQFPFISKRLQNDRSFILKALKNSSNIFQYLQVKFRDDKALVELAIKKNGLNLNYASHRLQNNEELVKKALLNYPYYYHSVTAYFKENKKFILDLLKTKGSIINELDESFKKDETFINLALKTYPQAIQYKDINQTTREEILSYIEKDANVLNVLDQKYKKDKEAIYKAVKNDASIFYSIDENLTKDKAFILELVKINSNLIYYIDKALLDDKEFLTKIIQLTGSFFEKASIEQKKDKEFVLTAIRLDKDNLQYADKSLQDNDEVVYEAVKRDGYALEFSSKRLQSDKKLVLKAITEYAEPLKYADESLLKDKDFMKKAINENSFSVLYAKGKLKNDQELILQALHQNKKVALYLDEKLLKNKDFIKLAIERNINILPHADSKLKDDPELILLSQAIPHPYQNLIDLSIFIALLSLTLFVYLYITQNKKKNLYLLLFAITLFGLSYLLKVYFVHGVYSPPYQRVDKKHPYGLQQVKCWIDKESNLSNLECYDMYVPEIYTNEHNESNSTRTISFPVRIFRSNKLFNKKAPFLHLGGGGPGASMGLEYPSSLEWILQGHDSMSNNIERDLIIIDPRGTGLAKPLLNCSTYGDNFKSYLNQHLSVLETIEKKNEDYKICIEKLQKEHVNFNGYNSLNIAKDIERLRQSLHVPKWTLFGVSYSTIYAQYIANLYPETVESMVLDSACFPSIMIGDHYVKMVMDGYNALYNYPKEFQDENETNSTSYDADTISSGIWGIHDQLMQNPLQIKSLNFELDGDTFISSLWEGVYGIDIFKDLPKILSEMEKKNTTTFLPYLKNYLYQNSNNSYADLSMITHECFEQQPFVDMKKIKDISKSLPEGYIQEMATDNLSSFKFCDFMKIKPIDQNLSKAFEIAIPTLFISGRYDSITPISDIEAQMKYFKHAQLLIYKNAHAVINNDEKMEKSITDFIQHPLKKIIQAKDENLTYTENNISL